MENADFDLLKRIHEGDEDALRGVLGKIKCHLTTEFKGSSCIANEAEDIAIEAVIRALKKRHEFRGAARLTTWLNRFAHYVALEYLREHKRATGRDIPLDAEHESIADSSSDPEEQLLEDEESQLKKAYAKEARLAVSEREWEAFEAVYMKRMGVKRFAEIKGMTEDAVSSLLRRAKEKMRNKLKGVAW